MSLDTIDSVPATPAAGALPFGIETARIPRTLRSSERRGLLLLLDFSTVSSGLALALWTWTITAGVPFSWSFVVEHRVWLLVIPLWLATLAPTRHARATFDLGETAAGVARAACALFVAYLLLFFYAGRDALPRLVALYVLWNCTLLVFGGRLLAWWVLTHAALSRRMLIVGEREAIDTTVALFAEPHFLDIQVVGAVGPLSDSSISGIPVVGTLPALFETAVATGSSGVVVATREVDDDLARQLLRCQEAGIQVMSLAVLYEQGLRRVPVRHLGPTWVVNDLLSGPARDGSPLAKRLIDVGVALLLGVAGMVLAPVLALAVLIESGRPVLYRQVRLGRGGRPFVLTKFRTMHHDAERNGVQWAQVSDPRSTRVGRWLRRSRLDELPNLLAVLRGDLSMVGPRPERPEFVSLLEARVPLYRARLTATPGLTGWAQVNHEYGDSVEDAASKLEYDLYYVKHQSFRFDIEILTRTVWTMLRFKGR